MGCIDSSHVGGRNKGCIVVVFYMFANSPLSIYGNLLRTSRNHFNIDGPVGPVLAHNRDKF